MTSVCFLSRKKNTSKQLNIWKDSSVMATLSFMVKLTEFRSYLLICMMHVILHCFLNKCTYYLFIKIRQSSTSQSIDWTQSPSELPYVSTFYGVTI